MVNKASQYPRPLRWETKKIKQAIGTVNIVSFILACIVLATETKDYVSIKPQG